MPEAVKKGALILACRSQNMDDFAWFKTALLNHLRPLHSDQVSVVEIHTVSGLIERLSAPGTLFDVSEVHDRLPVLVGILNLDSIDNFRPLVMDPKRTW